MAHMLHYLLEILEQMKKLDAFAPAEALEGSEEAAD